MGKVFFKCGRCGRRDSRQGLCFRCKDHLARLARHRSPLGYSRRVLFGNGGDPPHPERSTEAHLAKLAERARKGLPLFPKEPPP
jgi:hypothetical protein